VRADGSGQVMEAAAMQIRYGPLETEKGGMLLSPRDARAAHGGSTTCRRIGV
jgi:hypothetical protein